MARYARGTYISSNSTRMEIEHMLKEAGAVNFMYASPEGRAVIAFTAGGRNIRLTLMFADRETFRHAKGPRGRPVILTDEEVEEEYEQDCRERWRALKLLIKAKLAAVEAGITEIRQEFHGHVMLPGGRTVYEETQDDVALAYETGRVPSMLTDLVR